MHPHAREKEVDKQHNREDATAKACNLTTQERSELNLPNELTKTGLRSSARDHKDDASWYKYGRLATWTRQCTPLVMGAVSLRDMEGGEMKGGERGEASRRISGCDHTQEPGRASTVNIAAA